MTQCVICKQVKFWFQFFSEFTGFYTKETDICKKCANKLRSLAVDEYYQALYKDI